MDVKTIEAQARAELKVEDHRAAVEAAKQRIRERRSRSWWKRLFPYTVSIHRDN